MTRRIAWAIVGVVGVIAAALAVVYLGSMTGTLNIIPISDPN